MKIKCPKCGDYEEKEIIDSFGECAFCDHIFGEFIDEHKDSGVIVTTNPFGEWVDKQDDLAGLKDE